MPALDQIYDHFRRMRHLYYRHGYEHPVDDAWRHRHEVDWRAAREPEEK